MLKFFRIITVALLVSLMAFIFYMSAQTATESSGLSSKVIVFLAKIFINDFESLSKEIQNDIISSWQFFVRKGAHFSIYAVLGALAFLSLITYKIIPLKHRFILSTLICLAYSVSDEIHQSFVPGRSCELRDVCIDFCGSLLMIGILSLTIKYTRFKFIVKYTR